jgi:predicted lipopolysaccharide heptosyltransferase III
MSQLDGKKVLVIKLRYIGDALGLLPVIENINEKASNVQVDVMVNRGTEALLEPHPGIRKLWVYDRRIAKKSIIASIGYHMDFIRGLRAEKYDFVIDYTHGDRTAFLSFMTGAPERITHQKATILSRLLMNRIVPGDPDKQHIVEYQLLALKFLGLKDLKRSMTLFIPDAVERQVESLLSSAGIDHDAPMVVIHPGARRRLRRWRPDRFAEIARRIKETYPVSLILIGGPGEGDLVDDMEACMGFPPSFKSTLLSLQQMAALLRRSQLLIGNDTAPGHIAAAVNCPSLILFGPTFPLLWRPFSPLGEVIFKDVPCCGCLQESCIQPDQNCMDLIEVDEVWEKVVDMLARSQA